MKKVAVLGSGYMGSAVTFPLSERNYEVNLWGTWLDDEIIDTCRQGKPHPRLGKRLPKSIRLHDSEHLSQAVSGAEVVFMAVTSEGFVPVFKRFLESDFKKECTVVALTKGFIEEEGEIRRVSDRAERMLSEFAGKDSAVSWVSAGGPVKAVELAYGIPTVTIYGGKEQVAKQSTDMIRTDIYRAFPCNDVIGVELSSAIKNVYSIALGICDGMFKHRKVNVRHDNYKAFLFASAVDEMAKIVTTAGGKKRTVFGQPGVGDLYVTQASGRNGRLGELIGEGRKPKDAFELMKKNDQFAEGYGTLRYTKRFIEQQSDLELKSLPLLETLYRIVHHEEAVGGEMERFIEKYRCVFNEQ